MQIVENKNIVPQENEKTSLEKIFAKIYIIKDCFPKQPKILKTQEPQQ